MLVVIPPWIQGLWGTSLCRANASMEVHLMRRACEAESWLCGMTKHPYLSPQPHLSAFVEASGAT